MSVATATAVSSPPDLAIFENNLFALSKYQPEAIDWFRETGGPLTLCPARGRDGAATFAWTDEGGLTRWLGRTTMPTVRAAALADAFQAGDGNVLLAGVGQGAEVEFLLQRLAPHQAVMVVEDSPWAAACVLKLYDFSAALRGGRLLVFTGADAWQDLEQLLAQHDGYLEPQRILSWPWFDAQQATEVSQRLASINARLAAHRASGFSEMLVRKVPVQASPSKPIVAVLSTIPEPRIRSAAEVIERSAETLGWKVERFVLQDPSVVHPFGIRRALDELRPNLCILLDVTPAMLPYSLPAAKTLVLCTHAEALSEHWLGQLGSHARLGVVNEKQRRQAIQCGIAESRILLVPPAAQPGLSVMNRSQGAGLLVVANRIDPSVESAGLHLASHARLWKAASEIIRDRCDRYDDNQADDVFSAAEKQVAIKIASEDVRAGLIERIRQRLGPAIVRSTYLQTLHREIGEFELLGDGWRGVADFAECYRGPWPSPSEVPGLLSRYSALVVFEASFPPFGPFVDGLAAGLVCFYRDVANTAGTEIPGASLQQNVYTSRATLLRCLRRMGAAEREAAEKLSRTINERHTWATRLREIAEFCELAVT